MKHHFYSCLTVIVLFISPIFLQAQSNYFAGDGAGSSNISGARNTYVGVDASLNNDYGSDNTSIGYLSGQYNFGSRNSYFGSVSGPTAYSAAHDNVFMGYRTGTGMGSSNTSIGVEAGRLSYTGFNNVFLGYQTGYNTSTGNHNTFLGLGAGYANTTGQFNTSAGIYSGPTVANLVNATSIGARTRVSISNAMVLGSISGVGGATVNTKVGIRTTAPGYTLHVNASDAAKVGGGSWIVASDKRLKKDIADFEEGLATVMNIHPVWFRYNGKAGIATDKKFVGVIAQEMQKVAPYTVGEFVYADTLGATETFLDYDANALAYLLVNAVKTLKAENDSLKEKMEKLERLILAKNGQDFGDGKLGQSAPNPADGSATIPYFIPRNSRFAQLNIYNMRGEMVKSANLQNRGNGNYIITSKQLPAGTYSYHLLIDGKVADSKKLVVAR